MGSERNSRGRRAPPRTPAPALQGQGSDQSDGSSWLPLLFLGLREDAGGREGCDGDTGRSALGFGDGSSNGESILETQGHSLPLTAFNWLLDETQNHPCL